MLDISALSQLKQLKKEIKDSKEYASGIVKGTQRNFGFVVLEDKREIFLSPDEMQKVFPGDNVRILITTQVAKDNKSKAKVSGSLEKLINSPLGEFTGRYIVKGQGHFVEPDINNFSRWIFIPPQARKNAQNGDYIQCKIRRHPYAQGKPQAGILTVIGAADKPGIEAEVVSAKFQRAPPWPKDWQQQLTEVNDSEREDLKATAFVTIDGSHTQDMDDALYAKTTANGWQLSVAIADPGAIIETDSPLDQVIRKRAISSYLPGNVIPMLPEELSNQRCSLAAEEQRPALVCEININADGDIADYRMLQALVTSQAKLNYQQVSEFLDGSDDPAVAEHCQLHQQVLNCLKDISRQLLTKRKQDNLVIPNRQEYRLVLNEQKKLDHIAPQHKNSAQQLVEECMIAANRCAADLLGDSGLFISHSGFRPERLPDVKKLADEQLNLKDIDFASPAGYQQLMQSIDDEALSYPLRAVLSRLLERSKLTTVPAAHYGMALPRYTTFTSPLRKYSDLLVHRLIKAKLELKDQPVAVPSDAILEQVQQGQDASRQAKYQFEQWLKCQFIKPMLGQCFSGEVSQINSNGFTVRLNDNFIEGFVETRLLPDKYSFDPMRLRLSSKQLVIELNQAIDIEVSDVDVEQRSIRFTLPAEVNTESADSSELPANRG
ncbi:MAG: VacB/RNase II family 3'-5' exoribonuclease [Oceanicoccus sp.]|jgi:VacB/RNase II family 3'-5' exoribonuclease